MSSASEAEESMLQCKRSFLVVCFEDYPAAVSRSEAGDGRSDGEDEMGSVTKEGKSKEFRNSGTVHGALEASEIDNQGAPEVVEGESSPRKQAMRL